MVQEWHASAAGVLLQCLADLPENRHGRGELRPVERRQAARTADTRAVNGVAQELFASRQRDGAGAFLSFAAVVPRMAGAFYHARHLGRSLVSSGDGPC